jgi:hypothetical protein
MSERSLGAGVEVVRSQKQGSLLEVLRVATRLGLTSFGGPIAHLGYFHEEYVKRKNGSTSKAMLWWRCGHGNRTQWMDWSVAHSGSNFPSIVSLGHWRSSLLGLASLVAGLPIRS